MEEEEVPTDAEMDIKIELVAVEVSRPGGGVVPVDLEAMDAAEENLSVEELSRSNIQFLSRLTGTQSLNEKCRSFWAKYVPEIYRLEDNQDCLVPFKNTESVESVLIKPLACYLSGINGPQNNFFEFLAETDRPSTICGRVFQVGEATYTCRECGMDPTCVLCVDCFKASAHKNHRYKIATSGGGGYCDCGDPEAWKDHIHCDNHSPKDFAEAGSKPEAEGLEEGAYALLPVILRYCYEMTTSELSTNLPKDLSVASSKYLESKGSKTESELYCTVLYNDETHTFDLVIQTLTRALGCNKKDAIEFATTIDREGRSIVKVNSFQPCHSVQTVIERQTSRNGGKPLKVVVMKSDVVAHQAFALRLLTWLDSLCSNSAKLRKVLAKLLYSNEFIDGGRWLVEGIITNDTKLWKAARTCWHRLMISALLKDYETKKTFAEIFTGHYAEMMKDFILDDHDHSYSITSLSVQIFTVPSIAHHLVEAHDVLYTIMRTLLSECEQRLNSKRKLEFDRGSVVNNPFKRTNFAILDLKYVLTNPPAAWSDLMVKNFTHAIDLFLKLLTYMQEMDAVTRQVGQHMEYEPEWESAFNLHIKLQPVVQLSLEWCGSNKPVFIRAFRHCLQDLSKAYNDLKSGTVTLELANHSATCYVYDVASQPVSVHLPLTRYFAGLYLYLEKFDLEFTSSEFNLISCDKPVPEMIMEPALRTQVLIAQVNAGMWKRNGYALLNQLYFYHNVRCRTDMLDKDIITLQIAASVIESNEFLLHVINRFGLYQWVQTNFDEKSLKTDGQDEELGKYLAMLADEFFGLIITIVSARYSPGVGQVDKKDCIRKEVIQQLCIEPMTHSTLNKSLVENVNFETGLEEVVLDVANQKQPTPQRTSVVYELKPEFFADYDVYHFHYTREEMSKAEEKQRERKRIAKEPEFFPPPTLPPFTTMFNMVVNILQSDILLHLISEVLNRCLSKGGRYTSESLIRKVLHLIGHGLNEEIARNKLEQEHFFQFTENAKRWKIFETLDRLMQDSSVSHCHDMMMWLKKQYNVIKGSVEGTSDQVSQPLASLFQPIEEEAKRKKAEMIKQAKIKMMAKMAAAQQKFMAVNKDLFVEEPGNISETGETEDGLNDVEMTSVETVALGPNQTACNIPDEKYVCILCQEEQALVIGSKRFVLAAFVQRSTVLCQYREKLLEEIELALIQQSADPIPYLALDELTNPLFLNPDLSGAPVVSTCGHIMHESCWTSHIETVFNKERRRPYRLRHPLSFDVDKHEWLCPMCDSICNDALPMAVPLQKLYPLSQEGAESSSSESPSKKLTTDDDKVAKKEFTFGSFSDEMKKPASFEVWIQGMQFVLKNKWAGPRKMETGEDLEGWMGMMGSDNPMENILYCMGSVSKDKVIEELKENGETFDILYPERRHESEIENATNKWLSNGFYSRLSNFMQLTYTTGLSVEIHDRDFRVQLMFWKSLAFTIISSEAYHRDQMIPFFGDEVPLRKAIGLKYLTRACGVASDGCDKQQYRIEYSRSFAMRILMTLLQNPGSTPSLFECDAFGMLVSLTFAMPALFIEPTEQAQTEFNYDEPDFDEVSCQPPTGTCLDHHILRLTFMYHITQILVANEFEDCIRVNTDGSDKVESSGESPMMETDEKSEVPSSSTKKSSFVTRKECIFGEVWRIVKKDLPWSEMKKIDCEAVWLSIRQAAIPFLRCCAKFYENLTGIAPPSSLENVESSFEDLVGYLDLPKTFEDLFDTPFTWQMPYKWASHPDAAIILATVLPPDAKNYPIIEGRSITKLPDPIPIKYPRKLGNLTELPDDYTELINIVSNFTCKNSCNALDSRTPTMCLTCGKILCSQSYCCQRELHRQTVVGACVFHNNYCGGGTGFFLRIRECKLFCLSGQNRGCFMPPPYLDEYGETDQGLRRGNPLTLCKEKYEVFRKIWLQHGIPEEIARTTEHSTTIVATEWQYL